MRSYKLFFSVLFLFFLLPQAFSQTLDCQYTETISSERNVLAVYDIDSNQLIGIEDGIVFEGVNNPPNSEYFNIINPFNVPLTLALSYTYVYREPYTIQETVFVDEIVELPALDSVEIFQKQIGFPTDFRILSESVAFTFLDNNFVFTGFELIEESAESCVQCLGVQCLNDGEACSSNSECGGGYCINGSCSNAPVCFNNDCNCDPLTELQCPDNTKCVLKNSVQAGSRPICLPEECETGLVDSEGVCSKKDGEICSNAFECIGGNCVRSRCNNSPSCYNNDCECNPLTELQCPDNSQCVLKGFLAIGAMPVCSSEECTTSFVDKETGLCAVPLPPPANGGVPVPPTNGSVPVSPGNGSVPVPSAGTIQDSTLTYVIIGFALIFAVIAAFAIFGFLKAEEEKSESEVRLSRLKFKLSADEAILKSHGLLKKKKKHKAKKRKPKAKSKAEREKMHNEVGEQAEREAKRQVQAEKRMKDAARQTTAVENEKEEKQV